jgi:hypothetical protein
MVEREQKARDEKERYMRFEMRKKKTNDRIKLVRRLSSKPSHVSFQDDDLKKVPSSTGNHLP